MVVGRTKGNNKRYDRQEAKIIVDQIYNLFREHKRVINLVSFPLDSKLKFEDQINAMEIKLDSLILSDPSIYQGIQKIYRDHGVDIPSQHTIDKGEVIDAKKKILNDNAYIG